MKLFFLLTFLLSAFATAASPQKPNVLIIVADDMGFSDAGCYGSEIQTPNLDQLASSGLRFTQFYNTARCWSSRASLPAELDGTDLIPLLTKKADQLTRSKDLFWDWGDGIALQRDGWKIHLWGKNLALFNLKEDPYEFFDLKIRNPEKFKEMETALMARYNALPANGKSPLRGIDRIKKATIYVDGAPPNTPPDPRYLYPYKDGKPAAYPTPLIAVP